MNLNRPHAFHRTQGFNNIFNENHSKCTFLECVQISLSNVALPESHWMRCGSNGKNVRDATYISNGNKTVLACTTQALTAVTGSKL